MSYFDAKQVIKQEITPLRMRAQRGHPPGSGTQFRWEQQSARITEVPIGGDIHRGKQKQVVRWPKGM